jgi:hypothetical protein
VSTGEEVRNSGAGWEASGPSDRTVVCGSEGGKDGIATCPPGQGGLKYFWEDYCENKVLCNVDRYAITTVSEKEECAER